MVERLGGSDPTQGIAGHSAERSARSGDDELADFTVRAGAQRLGDGGVLTVDRHQPGPGGTSGVEDDGPADDEGFLVRQGHIRAAFEGGQGRAETGGTGDRVEDHVRGQTCDRLGGVVTEVDGVDGIGDPPLGSQLGQSRTHLGLAAGRRSGEPDDGNVEIEGLLEQKVELGTGGQADDRVLVPVFGKDVQGLGADRTG